MLYAAHALDKFFDIIDSSALLNVVIIGIRTDEL